MLVVHELRLGYGRCCQLHAATEADMFVAASFLAPVRTLLPAVHTPVICTTPIQ